MTDDPTSKSPTVTSVPPGGDEFDAFFSHASVRDGRLVRRVERYLEGFHRHWLLRGLGLRPLQICVDGSDFRAHSGISPEAVESVDETLHRYVCKARCLVVFCSPDATRSNYVDREIRAFFQCRKNGAVIAVVTAGDPVAAPETVFPEALIEREYHRAIWLDFRGAAPWWRRRRQRTRPFGEERTKLAAELHDKSPSILPAWKRAVAIKRRVMLAAGAGVVVIAATAWVQISQNRALRAAGEVTDYIENGVAASMGSLQQRSADAVRTLHVLETDAAFRRAAALTAHASPAELSRAWRYILSARASSALRINDSQLDLTNDIAGGEWRPLATGRFADAAISDDGSIVVAASRDGLLMWRDGRQFNCGDKPPDTQPRAIGIDGNGTRLGALYESSSGWWLVAQDLHDCGTQAPRTWRLWTSSGLQRLNPSPTAKIILSHGGDAVIAYGPPGWLLALVPENSAIPLDALNDRLYTAWQDDLPGPSTSQQRVTLAVAAEAFTGDGRSAIVAPARADNLSPNLDPRAMQISLNQDHAITALTDSRGTRLVVTGHSRNVLATARADGVRIYLQNGPVSPVFKVPGSRAVTMAFGAEDSVLLVADDANRPRLFSLDVPTGILLSSTPIGSSTISSMVAGGSNAASAIVYPTAPDANPALYWLRSPAIVGRYFKAEDHLTTAALLSDGLAVVGSSGTLRLARNVKDALQNLSLPGQSPSAVIRGLTVIGDSLFALLETGAIVKCRIADWECAAHSTVDPEVEAVAADREGGVIAGCPNGGVIEAGSLCKNAVPGEFSVKRLAVSPSSVLRMGETRACLGPRQNLDVCEALPASQAKIIAGAVSAEGRFVALAVRNEGRDVIHVFHRSLRLVPLPGWQYSERSRIPETGEVKALEFRDAGQWIRSASVWGTDVVVRCHAVTSDAMRTDTCGYVRD